MTLPAALPAIATATDPAPSFINSAGLVGAITFFAGIIVAIVGLSIMLGSRRANFSKTARTSGNAVIGIIFVVIGITGLAIGLGTAIYHTVAA